MDFSDFTNKLTQVTQSPGYLKGLDMIASTRPMTGTQARIDATQAQTAQGERELGLKEQDMQREVLKGQALQEFLKSGSPEAGKAYLMLGGNPGMVESNQLLQQQGMQSDATNAYTQKYGNQPSAGLSDLPPVMPPPQAPMQAPPMQNPQPMPTQPVNPPPMSQQQQPQTSNPLQSAEMQLRTANQKLAAAGATQVPGLIAAAQAEKEQAKIEYDRAKELQDKQLEAEQNQKKSIKEISIPGLELIGETLPNPAAVNQAREQVAARDKYMRIVDRINSFYDDYGSDPQSALGVGSIGSDKYKAAQAIISDLRNMERVVNETGVLNVGEVPFLEQSYAGFDPTNISNTGGDPAKLKEVAAKYLNNRLMQIDSNLKSKGYRPEQSQSPVAVPPDLEKMGITAEDLMEYQKGMK